MRLLESLLVLLPCGAFAALFLVLRRSGACWRGGLLAAAVAWGVLVVAITEGLGLFHLITRGWLSALWASITVGLCWRLIRGHRQSADRPVMLASAPREKLTGALPPLLFCMGLVTAAVGVIAILAPPNNWDSMAYHMPRVVHWMAHRTIGHYPTSFLPQLYSGPWAEFAILHLQALSGGDRFANTVQWVSMIGSAIGTSLIARSIGASLRGQVFAAVVAVSIPMGILEGSTTQNDYVVTFWLVAFLWYVLASGHPGAARRHTIGGGCSLGLAILTKGTAYIYAAPVVVFGAIVLARRFGWRGMQEAVVVVSAVLLLNGGHYYRNWDLFGSPIATGDERLINEAVSVPIVVSNVLRNLSLHVSTPSRSINDRIEAGIRAFHQALGADADDPRTTAWGHFRMHSMLPSEDYSGNPLHALLALGAIGMFLANRTLRRQGLSSYLCLLMAMFGLFCLLLKWQPWHSRLQLPLFVLLAPFMGAIMSRIRPAIGNLTAAVLLMACAPWVLFSRDRPLVPLSTIVPWYDDGTTEWKKEALKRSVLTTSRSDQYFPHTFWPLRDPYRGAAEFVTARGDAEIGLSLPFDAWEYPLWVLLGADSGQQVHVEHVDVKNTSAAIAREPDFRGFRPSAIIKVRLEESPVHEIRLGADTYVRTWSMEPVDVFVRAAP